MKNTWIVVADRTTAKLFALDGRSLELREELSHPEGRLQDKEIDSDRQGRAFDSHGPGRHAMERSQSPSEREAQKHAIAIAERMAQVRNAEGVERFVLVAEPGFLGELRDALGDADAAAVDGTLAKRLTDAPHEQLTKALSEILPTLA